MNMLTEQMFRKKLFELIKRDDSFYNCICQIIHDHELCPEDVGDWIKKDLVLMANIEAEFKIKNTFNDLF